MRKRYAFIGGMCLYFAMSACISKVDKLNENVAEVSSNMSSETDVNNQKGKQSDPPKIEASASSSMNDCENYTSGMYKVGTDIPSGEYMLSVTTGVDGYFCVSSDANMRDIIVNGNFGNMSIITVNNGDYLNLDRCSAKKYADVLDYYKKNDLSFRTDIKDMMYKVGDMLPAGEYKLITDSSLSGYYCVYSSSRQLDIISNKNFKNSTYVNVKKGQYLLLKRCHIVE